MYAANRATRKAERTPKQFEEAVRNRTNQRYMHTLIRGIDSGIADSVDSVTFDTDENNLIVITTVGENVHEYSIPLTDLTMNFKSIDKDVDYVCNYIKRDINACSNIAMLHPATDKFGQVTGSEDYEDHEDYYDYPKYSKTLYLPSIRQGKVKLTIGTFTDPRYDDDNIFEILAIVEVESRRDEFTLDSGKLYRKLDMNDGHEQLSAYDDRYDDIEDTVDEIYEYFMTLDQDEVDDTLIELADKFDVNRVNQMFGPMTTL